MSDLKALLELTVHMQQIEDAKLAGTMRNNKKHLLRGQYKFHSNRQNSLMGNVYVSVRHTNLSRNLQTFAKRLLSEYALASLKSTGKSTLPVYQFRTQIIENILDDKRTNPSHPRNKFVLRP